MRAPRNIKTAIGTIPFKPKKVSKLIIEKVEAPKPTPFINTDKIEATDFQAMSNKDFQEMIAAALKQYKKADVLPPIPGGNPLDGQNTKYWYDWVKESNPGVNYEPYKYEPLDYAVATAPTKFLGTTYTSDMEDYKNQLMQYQHDFQAKFVSPLAYFSFLQGHQ